MELNGLEDAIQSYIQTITMLSHAIKDQGDLIEMMALRIKELNDRLKVVEQRPFPVEVTWDSKKQ